jgi:hypothetical protein
MEPTHLRAWAFEAPSLTMIGAMTAQNGTGVPMLGLAEAARATNRSESTLRRHKDQLISLGASVEKSGWRIPVPALVQLGWMDRVTAVGAITTPSMTAPVVPGATPPEVSELRAQLRAAEQRAELAEARASERQAHIESLTMSLRMLEAAKPRGVTSEDVLPRVESSGRRRWWQRG